MLIDALEHPAGHQKKSRLNYSGKKRSFTENVQKLHTKKAEPLFRIMSLYPADAGYHRIAKNNKNSGIQFKRKKNRPLSGEKKKTETSQNSG